MKTISIVLTDAQVDLLLGLVQQNVKDGTYYGNRDYYLKRLKNTELTLLEAQRVCMQVCKKDG